MNCCKMNRKASLAIGARPQHKFIRSMAGHRSNAHLEYSVAEAELGGGRVEVIIDGGDAGVAVPAIPPAP